MRSILLSPSFYYAISDIGLQNVIIQITKYPPITLNKPLILKFIDKGINWIYKQRSGSKLCQNFKFIDEMPWSIVPWSSCIQYCTGIGRGHAGNVFNMNKIEKEETERVKNFQGKVKCVNKSMLIKPRGPMINGWTNIMYIHHKDKKKCIFGVIVNLCSFTFNNVQWTTTHKNEYTSDLLRR